MQENKPARAPKQFTVEEANSMLPLVRSIVKDICDVFARVTGRRSDLRRILRANSRGAGVLYDDEMEESRADLQEEYEQIWRYREELESLGIILRAPEEGSIEFPSRLMGKDCFLCWKLGEEQVRYFRENAPDSELQLIPALQDAN